MIACAVEWKPVRRFTLSLGSDVVQAWVWRWFQNALPQGVAQPARLITRFCDKRCNGRSTTQGRWSRSAGLKDHVSCLTCGREGGGTPGYLSGSARWEWREVKMVASGFSVVERDLGRWTLRLELPPERIGCWKLTCPATFEPSQVHSSTNSI